MHATMRYYHGQGGAFTDALVGSEDEVKRIVSEIDGFRAYYLIRTDDGSAVSISIYDDESGAKQSNEAAAAWVKENLPDISVAAPNVSAGEVVISA